ncbi:hypothetical protein C7N43_17990 [Sphingobacteriales bacterium UPWRP_1]|nr:hypothetical protein BVG80_03335 [Sphingobacteriales bacterium TSM_CSM]PSJ75599.1 hypothetical protein C7N43_17990 [Sphingobacteriales bacterium UPWRP_1]
MKNLPFILIVLLLSVLVVSCSKKATDSGSTSVQQKNADTEQAKIEEERLQKEKEAGKAMSTTPTQLPGYTPTGNPDVDAANYAKAKEDLYNNNPGQYQQWAESVQNAYNQQNPGNTGAVQPAAPQIAEIPYAEYIQIPQEKRDYIDAHPELYKVVK